MKGRTGFTTGYKSGYYLWSAPKLKWYWRVLLAPFYGLWIMYECLKGNDVYLQLGRKKVED